MFINQWIDKQIVADPQREYYLAMKRNEVLITCHNMDVPWKQYSKSKQSDAEGHILYDSIYTKCPE